MNAAVPILLAIVLVSAGAATAAVTLATFDEAILDYIPPLKPGVAAADHELWASRFRETYALAREDGRFNVADYWNLAVGFHRLQADPELVRLAFLRAAEVDPDGLSQYLDAIPHQFDEILPTEYAAFMTTSPDLVEPDGPTDPRAWAREQGLDSDLVGLVAEMAARDGRLRGREGFLDDPDAVAAQRRLDVVNAAQVDSLYAVHGEYLGPALVGERYAVVMWAVVQHSTIEMMERYLPVFRQAVACGDLQATQLKMLIDRVHHFRTGRQIFGSQVGVPLADAETTAQVKRQYGF